MKHRACPQCVAMGRDIHKDNLAVYDDGHQYCYSCHYYKPASTIDQLRNKLGCMTSATPRTSKHDNPRLGSLASSAIHASYLLSKEALKWLYKYGITDEEIHKYQITYDHSKDYLVFPIFDGLRLVATTSRYFGPNKEHPKYITQGRIGAYFKLFPKPTSSVIVLVEDFVSAIKVGRHFNCIPLLGSHLPDKLILNLVHLNDPVRIWLDPDKSQESIRQANRCRQYINNCGTILTAKDPKDYPDNEIKKIVNESISSYSSVLTELQFMDQVS